MIFRNVSFLLISFCLLELGSRAYAEDPPAKAPEEAVPAEPPLEPGTDYICEVDIFYIWKPEPKPKKPLAKPTSGKASSEPVEKETPVVLENVREFFTTAGDQGLVKEEIINRLSSKIPFYERQASDQCKSSHQDLTLCVSSRLRANFEQYNKLDYATRKAMTDGIESDCAHKLGKCLSTDASEIRCQVNRSPEVPAKPPGEAEAAAGGKEKEKEKKKK